MTLSEDQIKIIAEHPLSEDLKKVRGELHDCADVLSQNTLVRILGVLISSTAAFRLLLPSGRSIVPSLIEVLRDVSDGTSSIERLRPLVDLVVANAPDTDVWAAVLDLAEAVKLPTSPPSTLPPTFRGTPVKASSSRLDDSEIRSIVERELFFEVRNCTFRNVKGFWDKYFNPERWQQNQKYMLDQILAAKGEHTWEFPPTSDQNAVLNWLRQLETRFLAGALNRLYTTKTAYEFKERKGQVDIFFQSAARTASEPFEFKHVLIVGELKKSNDPSRFKADFLQLTRLVRSVFADQPTRRFVHAFSLCASTMELWVFDRSGPYSSGAFDIRREPEMFARALVGYATMDNDTIGRDVFIEKTQGNYQITLDDANSCSNSNTETVIRLTKAMVKQQAIVCRGTTCYKTENNQVAKFSWASAKRELELDQLKRVKEKGVQGVAKVVAYRQITTIAELRKGLQFPKPHRFQGGTIHFQDLSSAAKGTNKSGRKRKSDEVFDSTSGPNSISGSKRRRAASGKLDSTPELSNQFSSDTTKPSSHSTIESLWEDRIYSCLVISPAGRIISDFISIKELLESMRDAIKAHQSLYTLGGILHRDISSNNIIITEPEAADGFKGMLIDLDLAKQINSSSPSGARQQTGTVQFMAVEVLRLASHTYRHDLESFFYVLLWMCARISWTKDQFRDARKQPEESLLQTWVIGEFKAIAYAKLYHMSGVGFDDILAEFPDAWDIVKPLCLEIRKILFPMGKDDKLIFGTPTGHPDKLYNSIIAAYDKAISGMS
ncbi:serine/threonine-protein kinase Sgk2 [Xylaria sp. FL0933]|nr:serine/threonine-protein kinase Sgk2 [Xylaria sp. FL0933]